VSGEIIRRLGQISKDFDQDAITKVGYPTFRASTPIRSGNARRSTVMVGNEIRAQYPYATRLDQGYSKQSPEGMTQPTIEAMQKYIENKTQKG
jgi:hypothetical protein